MLLLRQQSATHHGTRLGASSQMLWRPACMTHLRAKATAGASGGSVDPAEDDEEDSFGGHAGGAGKPLRVERLLANLGYGKRKECIAMIKRKQLVWAETGQPAKVCVCAVVHRMLRHSCLCVCCLSSSFPASASSCTRRKHQLCAAAKASPK
jgi:hypothetical protein